MRALKFALATICFGILTRGAVSMDLKDVSSFNVGEIPTILRSTTSYGDIVTVSLIARGPAFANAKAGALGMLTAALDKGTPSYSKEDIDRLLNETGGILSIEPRGDAVEANLKCLKKFLPRLLPLFSEMIRVPLLKNEELEILRRQMIAGLKGEQEHPDGILALASHKAFFQGHPYAIRSGGFLETISEVSRQDLVGLLPAIFNKQNVFSIVIGDLSKAEATQIVTDTFLSLPEGKSLNNPLPPIQNKIDEIVFAEFQTPTTYFMARFKAPNLTEEDFPALTVGLQILDNRLFEEVRTKRALTYAVSAGMGNSLVNSGNLYVSSTNLPEAVKVMFDEVKKIQTQPITDEEIDHCIRKYVSSWWLARETPMTQAKIFGLYEILGLGWPASIGFIDRLKKVTPELVMAAMNKHLTNFTTTLVGGTKPEIESLIPGLSEIQAKAKAEAEKKTTQPPQATPKKSAGKKATAKPKTDAVK